MGHGRPTSTSKREDTLLQQERGWKRTCGVAERLGNDHRLKGSLCAQAALQAEYQLSAKPPQTGSPKLLAGNCIEPQENLLSGPGYYANNEDYATGMQ